MSVILEVQKKGNLIDLINEMISNGNSKHAEFLKSFIESERDRDQMFEFEHVEIDSEWLENISFQIYDWWYLDSIQDGEEEENEEVFKSNFKSSILLACPDFCEVLWNSYKGL